MHQDHNISWSLLSTHFKFIKENPHVTPRRTDLCAQDKPNQGRQLNHFVKIFARTVQDFAATERVKYPLSFKAVQGPSFEDTKKKLVARHGDVDAILIQNVSDMPEYADEIIELFEMSEMDVLLPLANLHRDVMAAAHRGLFGRSYVLCGWLQFMRYSLRAYLLINVIAEMPTVRTGGQYQEMESYKHLMRDLIHHALRSPWEVHVSFWMDKDQKPVDIFADMDKLHEYLKYCFRCLYIYLMVARECGLGDGWECLIRDWIYIMWQPRTSDRRNADWEFI